MSNPWRWPARQEWLLIGKLLVIMFTAYFAAQLLGLSSPIWAAATAAIIAGGTPGAATRSALSRIVATLIGLGVGLLMHWLLGHSLLAAAAGFIGASLFCLCFGLKQEMKLAGITSLMTTLVVQGEGLEPSLLIALWRACDILLGGLVGIVFSYLLLPQRAARELQRHIRQQLLHVSQLAHDILLCYINEEGQTAELSQRLRFHETASELRRTLQKESGMEPTDASLKEQLTAQILALEALGDGVTALLQTVIHCRQEPSRRLLADEFQKLAQTLVRCAQAWELPSWQDELAALIACDQALRAAFIRLYPQLMTPDFSPADLFHLTDVVLWSHRLVHGVSCLTPQE